jgi:hypothetical protein
MFAFEKQPFAITSTDRGMQIDGNEHLAKHSSSILASRDSGSNITFSFEQLAKHDCPRISTNGGMVIDFSEQFEKHDSLMQFKRDCCSNVTLVSREHIEKHETSRHSTEHGIQIDLSEQFEKHSIPIRISAE